MSVLQKMEEIDSFPCYLGALHKGDDGWITRVTINDRYKQWHYKYLNLMAMLPDGKDNIYISINTFYKPYRRIENIKELKAIFIDLDVYKSKFSKEQVIINLEKNYFNKSIPIPSFIIDSGRGLYLMWLIETVPSQALPLWKAIEEYFYIILKGFGADRQALDATRVLRVPGSTNSKSKTKVKILDYYSYRYSIREIQKEYMPELSENTPKKRGRPKKVVFVHRERSLYYARLQDIIKLCELREYDVKGQRELILFLYRYYLCYFTEDIEKSLKDTIELNNMFRQPLNEKEVIRATKSAEKVYLNKNKDYKYKNETLINLLEISNEEQKYMKTIISKEEYKYRENERVKKYQKNKLRNEDGVTKREQNKKDTYKSIQELKSKSLTQKEVHEQLGISLRTVKRHWN